MLFLILGAISFSVGIISGLIQIHQAITQHPGPPPQKRRLQWLITIGTLALTIVFLFASTLLGNSSALPPNTSQGETHTSTSTFTPTPTQDSFSTPTQTFTQTPPPSVLLNPTPTPPPTPIFPCNVDVGTWTSGSSDWKPSSGMLLNNGTNNNQTAPSIVAPCQLGNATSYAVEAKIQIIRQMIDGYGSFGITVRGSSGTDGWQGYMAGPYAGSYVAVGGPALNYEPSTLYVEESFNPGTGIHTYRVEVNGNTIKLLIDGGSQLTLTDNRYLTGSQVGLWSHNIQLQVTSFVVTAL